MNNPTKMTTRLDQIDGLVSLPPNNSMIAIGAKRKIDDVNNTNTTIGLRRRTPIKTTPFVQAPSTRPPRWNDVEVSLLQFLTWYLLLFTCTLFLYSVSLTHQFLSFYTLILHHTHQTTTTTGRITTENSHHNPSPNSLFHIQPHHHSLLLHHPFQKRNHQIHQHPNQIHELVTNQ